MNTNGWVNDPDLVQELMNEMPQPFFSGAAPSIVGSGRGKIVLLHEVLEEVLGYFPLRNQGSVGSCFLPRSRVLNIGGNQTKIDQVKIGDIVISHTGERRKVINTMSRNFTGILITFCPKGWNPITSTEDHRFPILRNGEFIWIDSINIKCGDKVLIGYDKNVYSVDNNGACGEWREVEKIYFEEVVDELVYDITVEHDHSFVCDGIATHNCVAVAAALAIDALKAADIKMKGDREKFELQTASEDIYGGSRVQIGKGRVRGDGSLGIWASKYITEYGTVRRQKYGNVDLTKYSESRCRAWGRSGPPKTILEIAKEHPVEQYAQVRSYDEVIDSLANGYPVTIASNVGFNNTRDREGFLRESGSWAHQLTALSFDDKHPRKGVGIANCFSDDTEILTDQGWKLFQDLNRTEKVASVNLNTWTLEYQKPTDYQKYNHVGIMHHYKGKFKDILVTPDHNMVSLSKVNKNKGNNKFDLIKSKDIKKSNNFIRYAKNVNDDYKEIKFIEVCGHKIEMKTWLNFLGFFLSEGWSTVRTRERTRKKIALIENDGYTGLSQDEGSTLDFMEDICNKLPFKFSKKLLHGSENHYQLVCYSLDFAKYMSQFGKAHEKFIPEYVFNLPSDYKKELFKTLMLGDGTACGTRYYTNSKKLRDGFQRLCIELGMISDYFCYRKKGSVYKGVCANHDIWNITCYSPERNGNNGITKIDERKEVDYDGFVYCVSVPNKTVLVRRNGKILITGNSWGPRWCSGPRRHGLPEGCFWVDARTIDKMCRQGDSWSYCGIKGYPRRIDGSVMWSW